MRRSRFARAFGFAAMAVLGIGMGGTLVMSLWNALMPQIFDVRAIGFWQALGLLVLSKILFGGFRPQWGGGTRWRRRMMERWEQMTPEERQRFKEGMRRGCRSDYHEEAPREASVRV